MEISQVLDAALRKAAAIWITVPERRPRLVWALWRDGAVWVAVGGEQDVPGLTDGVECSVTLRSPTTHSHLLDFATTARLAEPDDDIATALDAVRLNGTARWTSVYRMEPA